MNYPPIVIRIHAGEDGAMDWTVQPDKVSFQDALEVISRVLPGTTVPAFEYEDEDGDRITVRSNEEMTNMIECYLEFISTCQASGTFLEPLAVYPRVGKPPERRNIHGLKVQTRNSEPNTPTQSPMVINPDSGSRRQQPKDIREILGTGTIVDSDLHYLEILGSGNAGTVYKANHKPTNTVMAVKVIKLDITPEVQRQIMSELEILYKCKSSVIIAFYGAFFMENRISMCTEFMDGGSLDKYGQIEEHILGRIAVSVLKSLQYLWNLRIMHRDVKPSNMLVNTQGQVKLCDFGVSVQLVNSIAKTVVGTSAYMAPERIKAEDYSIHSDVWSLGVSLFELAAGRFPFDSIHSTVATPFELMASIVQENPPQLPNGVFSDALVNFVGLCMQKDPLKRPSPEMLMKHPYIERYDNEDSSLVAQWVRMRLGNILLKQKANHKSSA